MGQNLNISSDYLIINMHEDGRGFSVRMQEGVSRSPHFIALQAYVQKIHESGVERINADHMTFDFLDRSLDLRRGKRKLDVVYLKDGKLYECELKTGREVGINRTWDQVKDQAKFCDTLTLLVPTDKIEWCKDMISSFQINNVVVDSYEY